MSTEPEETSESGAPIYRYDQPLHSDFVGAGGEPHLEEIQDHVEAHVGPVESVLHEVLSHLVHLDVLWVRAAPEREFHALVTSGMSDLPMRVPPESGAPAHLELCVLLPPDWPFPADMNVTDFSEEAYWPVRWLKQVARFPHEYGTWMGEGHTIPNGEKAEPFAANTKLGCWLLLPSVTLPEAFGELTTADGHAIHFLTLIPIYREEMDYKLRHGLEALLERFVNYRISDVIDPARVNTCRKRGLFGWW